MAEKTRWGILGNAEIARVCVIPAIQKSRNSRVHALATRSPDRAREIARTHEISKIYDSYDALLADPAVDVVYIPLPNHLHHPWTLKALEVGKHVLCEKPLARNTPEAEEMAHAASRLGLLLMEGFMYRFHPRSQRIKQMVTDGKLGKPCLVRSAFCYNMGEELLERGEEIRLRPEMGGGALLDIGCYSVSVARWLLGTEPVHVKGEAVFHPAGVDLHFVGLMRFPNDALATLEASFISALQQTYTIIGSEAAIELPHDAFIPWEKDTVFSVRTKEQETGQMEVTRGVDEYQLMVEHFGDAVQGGTSLDFPPEESVCNMRVLDGLAEAARTGETTTL
jgi:predicted dehydrogenase